MKSFVGGLKQRLGLGLASSLSDDGEYPQLCLELSSTDKAFRSFRDSAAYSRILEHTSPTLARQYWARIASWERLPQIVPLLLNDSVGDPETIAIPGIGRVTGSSLRYANVTMDLVAHFGELEGMVINEVGVGYGGQCRIIKSMFPTVQYRLIDLASVLPLAKRYLTESGVGDGLEFIAAESGPRVSGDLFISNYAFSELRRGNQEAYLRDVALKCSRGYAIYNAITPRTFKSLSAQAFARRAGGHIGDEEPLSYPGNCLVWWDKHRSAE